MKTNKQFDCIKLKNEIQQSILDETSGMNTDELLKYFNSGSMPKPQTGNPEYCQLNGTVTPLSAACII